MKIIYSETYSLLIDTYIKDPPSANIFLTPILAAFRLLFSLSSTSRGFAANAGGFGAFFFALGLYLIGAYRTLH
ncbi:uncharacterized protein EDB91DRAFT_1167406 [Suillus paluster]|uniref:uncharacterized protein n=1 Tax=Suillus paluster TaxID=48578 RepID=UPI001B882A9E|nr:uncharacterized protein EDB91DRAFT_1167406 [Suillus paluster]KAG1725814.1 hypothetical protein EDB91DRAFT_1167406 [Suillus paluster]